MDSQLFAGLRKFKWHAGRFMRDDDFADRLNHTFTSFLLVIFTLIVSARQYFGQPIACYVNNAYSRAEEEYIEALCWVKGTYLGTNSKTRSTEVGGDGKLLYYQLVPFILIGQVLFFNIPCIIWRLFNWRSGINLVSVMQVACDVDIIKDRECRKVNVSHVANQIDQCLNTKYINRTTLGARRCIYLCCNKMSGSYLICLYIICKILYIINIISQLYIMNRLLGTNNTFFGLDLFKQLAGGKMWHESGHFPRETVCNILIRSMGSDIIRIFQCALSLNMLNEKIFIFLCFWFVLVLVISICSFISLTYKIGFAYNRIDFVYKFLKLRHKSDDMSENKCRSFIEKHLRHDGVFLLRLLAQNAGDLIASEITDALWRLYIDNKTDTKSDLPQSRENLRLLASDPPVISIKPQITE